METESPAGTLPSLAENVRALREARNMSQADLARASGLSRVFIKQIEDGARKEPSARTVGALSQALEVHVIDMMQCAGALPGGYHEAQINSDLELTMHLRRQRRLSEDFVNTLLRLVHLAEIDEKANDTAETNESATHFQQTT